MTQINGVIPEQESTERRSNLNSEIATLPSVSRNDIERKVIYETVHESRINGKKSV